MPSQSAVRTVGYIGAAANWLIPLTTLNNVVNLPANNIDPIMTGILALYSGVFMRWALAIAPANYPLAACHVTNFTAQLMLMGKQIMYADKKSTKK
jgi:hypothetical protein